MSETKYTPGPWHIEKHQRFMMHEVGGPGGSSECVNTWFDLIAREDEHDPRLRTPIAEVTVSTEAEANARLIAAAPELLEALEFYATGKQDAGALARAVLAKATLKGTP